MNADLYQVTNTGVDNYIITTKNKAAANAFGGGTNVLASYNRKFEKVHAIVPNISFSQTKIDSTVKTTNIAPVDDNVGTFTSYSQSEYEKTFLNEDFFFVNQKVLASRINETVNSIDRSLTYKIDLSSTVSHLSPLVDLSRSSLKTITNRVESATGSEDRFGRRDQVLEFYPVYSFTITNTVSGTDVSAPGSKLQDLQTVTGMTSSASGTIVKVNGSQLTVNVKTTNTFTPGEGLKFSSQTALNPDAGTPTTPKVTVSNADITQVVPSFPNTTAVNKVIARSPDNFANVYENKIDGAIVLWDNKEGQLTVVNDKQPISNDYIGKVGSTTALSRKSDTSLQATDIFRVDDIISYTGQTSGEEAFIQVSKVTYTDGIDYVPDSKSKDSSSIA